MDTGELRWASPPSWNFFPGTGHSMSEVEDAELLERARKGDERAFAQLFGRYQAAIYRYAVHMCSPDAGDDVVQETFLAVLRQSGRTDAPRNTVAGYLFGIARHVVLQRLGSKYQPAFVDQGDEDVSQVASNAMTAHWKTSRARRRSRQCARPCTRCRWRIGRSSCCAIWRTWTTRPRPVFFNVR